MNELTGVSCDISEQHMDTTPSRLKRDTKDTHKVLNMLKDLDPFDPQLCGLVTGVYAHESVNADDAKTVGQLILDSMVGQSVRDISFQRKTQAVTLAAKTAVNVDDESVQIDPQLLFQRLSLIATNGTHDNPASVFKYELCSHPPALFDAYSLPWTANKPSLAEALWKVVEGSEKGQWTRTSQ